MDQNSVKNSPKKSSRARKCPICRLPTIQQYRPFCSKRCADIDLGRWLNGGYVIPGHEMAYGEPEQGE